MPLQSLDYWVSVVMPVHNALPHLDRAVESILAQSHRQFEFVIYDDGSTDGSTERLREWAAKDSRIRLVEGDRNLGPPGSSNAVSSLAKHPIIARMDADDISDPDRIRQQLQILAGQADVVLVGSLCDTIDGSGRTLRGPDLWRITRRSWFAPFPHGSIMYRREAFERIGGYRQQCSYWEDQDFALRMSSLGRILVIPRSLYKHRHSYVSTRLTSDQDRVERSVDLMYRAMGRLLHRRPYDDLLADRDPAEQAERIDPRVFVSLGSLTLWSGGRPRLFGRLVRRGRLGFDSATATALVWTCWASVAPASLRRFVGALAKVRNRSARNQLDLELAHRWKLPATLAPVERDDGPIVRPDPKLAKAGRGS